MKRSIIAVVGILSVFLFLAGCGGKEAFPPVPIDENVDRCEECNMAIADDHNATEIILKDGKPLKYDDIGDMFLWTKKNGTDNVAVQYVRDYHSMEWLKLEEAWFVYDKGFKTPMAYGVYSFKDKQSAEAFVDKEGKGQLMSLEELNSHHWERNMEMMKQMKMEHGGGHMDNSGSHGDNMNTEHSTDSSESTDHTSDSGHMNTNDSGHSGSSH